MSDGQRDNTEEGLRMDEDSPISRAERTFWTVWSYIAGAVSRFFRPEPTNVPGNDQNSIQESAVDSEPANCGHAERDTSGGGVDEEQPVATAALLSSSRPLVAWELCTTEIKLGPDEESVPCETQLSRGNESEACEEGEGTEEEQLGQAGNDDAGVLFAQDDKREENGDEELHTRRQDETEEHANVRSLKTTGDAVSADMEESRRGAEDTDRAMTQDETIHVKEAEDKMQHEDEQDLQAEDSGVKLCLTADLTAVEEAKMQQNEADTAVMHEEVGNADGLAQLASESESDEGVRQVEHQLSACEESSGDHRDFKEDPGFSPLHVELQMTCDNSSIVSEDEPTAVEQQRVTARRSESDEIGDTKEETDGSTLDVSEAANNQTVDEAPEQEDDIKTLAGVIVCEHVTYREEAMLHSPEQEEVVTHSEEFMQNALQMEEEIKTVTEDIVTEHVMSGGGFVQNPPEQEDDITTVTDDTLTEHVTRSEEFVQYLPEQEDDSLTEHVTGSEEFVQNAPELEEEIKTVAEDIITEVVISSCEFVQNAPEREDDITTVTDDTLTEHVTRSEEFVQHLLEQEDNSLTAHVTGSEEFVQNAPELEEEIKTVAEDIITEVVISSCEFVQNALEQEDDIETVTGGDSLTEHATCSEEVTQNAPEREDDITTVADDTLTEHVTCSKEFVQNAPEQDDDIKTVSEENILIEYVTYSEEFTQNAPNQDTCSKDAAQYSLDQDDDIKKVSEDILTEHITYGEDVMLHSPEQEDDIKAVTGDIIIEHVICSEEFVQHAPEQEDDIETLTADVLTEHVTCSDDITQNAPEQDDIEPAPENDILTEHVTRSEEFMQNAESELHTADLEQEDVAEDAEVQTKTREADDVETESHGSLIDINYDITTHTSAGESYFAQVEEESLSSEAINKESDMEIARTATSVMDKPDGETGQEMSGEFKNIPRSMCEGRVVVSEELNSPTREETREGVPEYNNEPDENTTPRFLEDGGYGEIQGSQLPEEVESKEPESLQNSGWSAGADCLLVREHMGEEQGVKNSFEPVVGDHAEILWLAGAGMPQETETPLVEAVEGSGRLIEVADGELLVDLMKTEIEEKTEEESESDVESTNKDDKATEEPRDATEELLVDLGKDEGLCDSKVAVAAGVGWETTGALVAQEVLEDDNAPEAEVQKTTETSYFQGLIDAMNSEQHLTSSLLDDITQSELLKHSNETESILLEDVGIQGAGLEAEETGYAVEVEAAADEMQGRNEMEIFHPQATEMAEPELRSPVESLETKYQPSDEVLEISSVEMLPEAAGESKAAQSEPQDLILISTEETTKHVRESEGSHAEETVSSISGRMDVIDEEILNLWMQTASSEDNDGIQRQEGPEPSNEEQGEISSAQTEKDEEQLVDLEMSSSTVESGFLDQSLGEWGTQSNETQQPKSTESFQGIHDLLANMFESADISQSSAQHSDFLMEKTAETDLKQEESITAIGVHPDSGVTSPEKGDLNQESSKSQEETKDERVEAVETETGSQKEIGAEEAELAEKTDWKDTEEADVQSEKTQAEDEPLERSDSADEIKHTESEQSGSSSEASLEEGVVLTESSSQDDTCTESERLSTLPSLDEPQARQSEDTAESEAGAEVAEQLTAKSADEVDTFVLDFTVQRSRIAVKNPRVRPPKDPRSLLHMPSLDPTPSVPRPSKVPIGVPLGGMGIGIKLPGLGAGFPVLKKTQQVVRDENKPETPSEETKPEEKSDTPKQDEAPHRPKWMPPKHPGFGNPLMSELKSKLKKTTQE